MSTPTEALQRLIDGNRRFAAATPEKRAELVDGQAPFAIVLSCSDSRVPVENVFDQCLGDLFVVRVAGNIATPTQLGSIEFAATQFGASLIVVLGHSGCGAIKVTLEHLAAQTPADSPHLQAIADQIAPAIAPVLERHDGDTASALDEAVTANIRATATGLPRSSRVIEQLVNDGKLEIVGAHYSLQTGRISIVDDARD